MSNHGYGAYTNGCRCEVCRAAKADYMRERRAAAHVLAQRYTETHGSRRGPGAVRFVASNVIHGSRYAYIEHGCRCFDCTDANTAAGRKYRSAS